MRTRSDHSFRTLLEAAPDAMIVVDDRGVIQLVNSQAEAMFGYTRDEMFGVTIEMLVPDRLRARHETHRTAYAASPGRRPMGVGLDLYGGGRTVQSSR